MASNGIINQSIRKMSNMLGTQSLNTNHISATSKKCWTWDISSVIHQRCRSDVKYAVIVLNRPIIQSKKYVTDLWNSASVRMLVDGGTLRWNTFLSSLPEETRKTLKIPDYVTGDFDSVTDDILENYRNIGSKVIHTLDQQYTDFTKAIMELNNHCKQHDIEMEHVVAIAQTAGRIDQTLGNIHTLFLAKDKNKLSSNTNVYILGDDSLSWLLDPGDHVIRVPEASRNHKKPWCSLVPVGAPCDSVTTSGLVWDMDKTPLQFGELISTSNLFGGPEVVTVNCSHTLLWSMRVPNVFDQ